MLFINREKRFSNLIETTQKKYRESKDREFVQTTKNLYVLIISIIFRSLTSFHINWVDNMNSAYNDFYDLFGEELENYVRYSKMFIKDDDAKEDKVFLYFVNIPKED